MVHSILRPGAALLEREAELAALDGALATARDGSGRLLLVEGPPGIGKTTLLAAARERAHEDGFAVLDAVCDELEAAFPFGVAVQLLEPALRALGDRERAVALDGPAALAAALLGQGAGKEEDPATRATRRSPACTD